MGKVSDYFWKDIEDMKHDRFSVGQTHWVCVKHEMEGLQTCCECEGRKDCKFDKIIGLDKDATLV